MLVRAPGVVRVQARADEQRRQDEGQHDGLAGAEDVQEAAPARGTAIYKHAGACTLHTCRTSSKISDSSYFPENLRQTVSQLSAAGPFCTCCASSAATHAPASPAAPGAMRGRRSVLAAPLHAWRDAAGAGAAAQRAGAAAARALRPGSEKRWVISAAGCALALSNGVASASASAWARARSSASDSLWSPKRLACTAGAVAG